LERADEVLDVALEAMGVEALDDALDETTAL
jgi:uncharacterized protein YunC (DUF1805 family)